MAANLLVDHCGRQIRTARMGYIPTLPVTPKVPVIVKSAPNADAVGYVIGCEEFYPLIECHGEYRDKP